MPRAIDVPQSVAGVATYQLGQRESFTVLAVTFNLVPLAGAGGDNFAWLDMRDPTGRIIHLQPLAPGDGADMFYSLAVGAEPFLAETNPLPATPQNSDDFGYYYVSQRLAPVTLTGRCTINAYKTVGSEQPPTDPLSAVSADYSIPNLHLWVADVGRPHSLPPTAAPLLTHAA